MRRPKVIGVGDQRRDGLPPVVRRSLASYVQVPSLWDTPAVASELRNQLRGHALDRIECLWEPGMELAAQLRETFNVQGMGVEQTRLFRDKEAMKVALDAAGIRTPRHIAVDSVAGCWAAAEEIGFPDTETWPAPVRPRPIASATGKSCAWCYHGWVTCRF